MKAVRRVTTVLFLILPLASVALAESHPRVWSLASPDSTSVVGIQWQYARSSVFGEAIRAELAAGGGLDLPDFEWLAVTDQILVTGPEILVVATGAYHAEFLKQLPKGVVYRNIEMRGTSKQTAALLNEQTLLMGLRKTVQAAIERSFSETRRLNPLFAKGAALAAADDFWVIARRLPDPMVATFVPMDAFEDEVDMLEGGMSFHSGLNMHATLRASSVARAKGVAEHIQKLLPELPQIVRKMQVQPVDDEVKIELNVSGQQLVSSLRAPAPSEEAPAAKPEKKPEGPQIIRIFGLDSGPKEILLKKPDPENQR